MIHSLALIFQILASFTHLRPRLTAGSIFSSYLLDSGSSLGTIQVPTRLKKNRCHKCRRRCRRCCKCKCKGHGKKKAQDVVGDSDVDSDLSDSDDEKYKGVGCCRRFLNFFHRKHSQVFQEELEEWQEDLAKVESVTPGFHNWLTDMYKRKKKNAKKRRTRLEMQRKRLSWAESSKTGIASRGSIVSLKEMSTTKLEAVNQLLLDIHLWDFDTFLLQDKSHHPLLFIAKEVFRSYDFMQKFRIKSSALKNLLKALEAGYTMHGNPYHNDRHAADVTQTVHALIQSRPGFQSIFTDLEIFALIFAALIHDLAHPGTTNNFHINAQTQLALLYNDKSILENHHVASAFQLLKNPSCNILENLKPDEYKEFRTLVIEMVLGTDMAVHFQHMKAARNCLKAGQWDEGNNTLVTTTLSLMLHSADISNPAKPWLNHKKCADAVMTEYLAQGFQERALKLSVSPLCDPKDQNAATQITFVEVIVAPTFQVLGDLFDMIFSNENKGETYIPDKTQEERRHTLQQDSMEPLPGSFVRVGSPFGLPPQVLRKSKEENSLLLRPWVAHLHENMAQWKKLQEIEAPVVRIRTSKSLDRRNSSTRRRSTKPNQVMPI